MIKKFSLAGVLAMFLLLGQSARATTVFMLSDILAQAGSTGQSVDILLTNNGPDAITVAGFSFGVAAPAGSGIQFTSVSFDTLLAVYIFQGTSLFGPDITDPGQTLPGYTITSTDLTTDINGITIAAGSTVSLGHIFFNVDWDAPQQTAAITITDFPVSSLSNPNGDNIEITNLVNGSVTVVPEPGTMMLMFGALTALAALRTRHVKRWS